MTNQKSAYKEVIANALAETGTYAFLGMSECEKYGMAYGCDEDCPVYRRGECENEVTLAQLGDNRKCKRL